ncbi:MAG: hypothetical protein ACOYOF_09245 [Verrucomicrobiaceae bacterium]
MLQPVQERLSDGSELFCFESVSPEVAMGFLGRITPNEELIEELRATPGVLVRQDLRTTQEIEEELTQFDDCIGQKQ